MGRSKFPGKPSKHLNRTRINVLSTDLAYVTTVVDDTNATVVTVVEEVSKKDYNDTDAYVLPQDPEPPDNKDGLLKIRKTRVTLNKLTPHKKNIFFIDSPLCSSTQRLTRSKVITRRSFTFNNRKVIKPKIPKKETPNLVGKFVLPSRSVHSSRVIKPNKRFINVEQGEVRIIKKRVLNKRQCVKSIEKDNNKSETAECDKKLEAIPNTTQINKLTQSPPLNRRVVLRKARLQIKSKTPLGPEGPFSISTSVLSQSGTVTCGVCGAIRFYRFIKQARKFNIYSCGSCRKFISKHIQISNNKNLNTSLNCHKGQGTCHVPPIVRSQQWKFNKIAYNSRCPACWLKLCLRSFQVPMVLKTSLSQLLPKHMQLCDTLFTSSLPLLTWQSQTNDNKSNEVSKQSTPTHQNENTLRQRPVRNFKRDEKPTCTAAPPVDIKRPKIDTKGPRVKHVCRSASIVLGQPIAVFPDDKNIEKTKTDNDKGKAINKAPETSITVTMTEPINDKQIVNESHFGDDATIPPEVENLVPTEIIPIIPITHKIPYSKVENIVQQPTKKEKQKHAANHISMLPFEMTKPSFSKKMKPISKEIDTQNLIDIHYWENYDPDEVLCNGLGIMSSERFPMQAICYLCGSAGKGTLLHCCSCCEPYHPHCLEQPPNFKNTKQKYTWICPKCTACAACDDTDRQKIQCQKCHKAYHPQCFNTKWRTDDRPTVCSNCLRCKSCGTDNITKFIGNLALCLLCFKLRNKGNYCPLCQCCYDDNDFDTKMMECGKCYKWVHAKCEGLSDEQYQILSILPESVEFLCCLCSNKNTPQWRKSIQSELKSCFNNILRLLSKHKIVRETLKLSPLKAYIPTPKQLNSARRLQFTDSDEDIEEPLGEIDNDLERVKDIFKNKIDFGESFKNVTTSSKIPCSPNMLELRNKLNCTEYFSLRDFNESMEHALKSTDSNELLGIYRTILKNVFPWFDPTMKPDANQSICEVSICKNDEDEEETKFKYDFFDVSVTNKLDNRICGLCKGVGDGLPTNEARLLYCGHNVWIHSNCALWSSEVYEEIDGSLQNVQGALTRGRSIKCSFCKQKGASVGCCLKGCKETFHFPCAQKAECVFIVDKTIYCKTHDIDPKFHIVQTFAEFEIRRSVYVEVDCKKNKYCEPEKVNFMVGSLSVYNLGKVIPNVSDNIEAIIPVGFVCSRLFWSTTEPWKLVSYKISTSILNKNAFVYVDKNFTVDHTLPKNVVERKIREISSWMKDDKEKTESAEFDFEEPQNAADILSPELTDALLEELPHDLLDGITWTDQDMLMGYEELLNMDFKNTEINYNENISLNVNSDANIVTKALKVDDKSIKLEKPRNQQRSCGVTWLQLDQTLSPAMKKRKVMPPRDKTMFMPPIIQVDGGCDSSGSECGSPTHESEQIWTLDVTEQPVTCEKCQSTYRTNASYNRHLESCCDSILTSESETESEMFVVAETHETLSSHAGPSQNLIKIQESPFFYNFQQTGEMKVTQTQNTPEIYCVVAEKNSIAINQPTILNNTQVIGMNGIIDQSLNIQQIPFSQDLTHLLNPQMNQGLNIPQNQWIRPIIKTTQQNKARARIVVKKPVKIQTSYVPQNSHSVILQHLPNMQNTTNMQNMLPFVDLTHQEPQQNVQFIATLSPQINSTITQSQLIGNQSQFIGNQTQLLGNQLIGNQALVQLPGENNFLSLVPNMQPMIIQQPNNNGQIIMDANGSMVWAPHPVQQVQPIYYGFETIVQNTVMQSQQFLPTTVPGVLATNSSYSATTQVFQTSKLEPVLDNSGYVLVNNHQIVNQSNTPQIQSSTIAEPSTVQSTQPIVQSASQPIIHSTPQPIMQSTQIIPVSSPTSTVTIQNTVTSTAQNIFQQSNSQSNLQSAIQQNIQTAQTIQQNARNAQVVQKNMEAAQAIRQNIQSAQAIQQNIQNAQTIQHNIQSAQAIQQNIQSAQAIQQNIQSAQAIQQNIQSAQAIQQNIQSAQGIQQNIQSAQTIQQNIQSAQTIQQNIQSAQTIQQNIQSSQTIQQNMQSTQTNLQSIRLNTESVQADIENNLQESIPRNIQSVQRNAHSDTHGVQRNMQSSLVNLQNVQRHIQSPQGNIENFQRNMQSPQANVLNSQANVLNSQANVPSFQTNIQNVQLNIQDPQTNIQSVQRNMQIPHITVPRSVHHSQTNIQTVQRNLQIPHVNVQTVPRNIQNSQANIQSVQRNIQAPQTNTQSVQRNIQSSQANIQSVQRKIQSLQANIQSVHQNILNGHHTIQRSQLNIHRPRTNNIQNTSSNVQNVPHNIQSIPLNIQSVQRNILNVPVNVQSIPLNIQNASRSSIQSAVNIRARQVQSTMQSTPQNLLQTAAQIAAATKPTSTQVRAQNTAPRVAKPSAQNGPPPTILNGAQKPRTWSVQKVATSKSHEMKAQVSNMKLTGANPNGHNNSISLPIAPFIRVPEQGIPTNIVTPTPKPPTSGLYRPMSRVLPMQTIATQLKKQEKNYQKEMSVFNKQATTKVKDEIRENQMITILDDVVVKPSRAALTEQTLEAMKLEFKEVKHAKEVKDNPHEDLVKLNKVQIVQLKQFKPKPLKTDNKENASIEFNADLPDDKLIKKSISFKIENDVLEDTAPKIHKRTNPNTIYYKIESADGVDYAGSSLTQLWSKIFNDVQTSRLEHNLPPLPDTALRSICGFELLGLKSKGMKYLIEQLPDAIKCKNYKHRFRKPSSIAKFEEEDYEEYCRRCLPYDTKPRKKYDMFSWLSSKYRTLEMYDWDSIPKKNTSSTSMSTRHKTMTAISKYSVGVYRSEIHGRGLFSLRDIESGDMVIEYCGEVIRSALTDKRERFYTEKSIGCYMFRIDDNLVVDATMKGNSARFINHSCDPNCYSKVVEISGDKHIIIFALRKIICGEELTYDYKFPFEDDKIPCSCGTRRCRKFLN